MKKKTFDCIAFLNNAAEGTRLRLASLPVADQMAYWRRRNKEIAAEQKRLMKKKIGAQEYGFSTRLEALRKKQKSFDCVEMKHRAQERIRKELSGKSPEEQAAYWRKKVDLAHKHQGQARDKRRPAHG